MATSDELAHPQQYIALLLAKFVRDGLEDIHHRGDLPQSLMRELNTAIRDAIYTGLFVLDQSETDLRYAEYVQRQQRAILTSGWEAPTLWPQIAHPRSCDAEYLAQLQKSEDEVP